MQLIETSHDIGDETKHALRFLNEDKYDVIHVHLKKGESLSKHHAKCEVLVIVRTGKLIFEFEEEKVTVTNERVLQMEAFEEHRVDAIEETDFLLFKVK